ncbi:MAG: serine hydrolase [Geminicoccaceae bacterium]|nr:serine hydrolase [Geminicoccaceae bacterium]
MRRRVFLTVVMALLVTPIALRAQDGDVASLIARIEGPQTPNRQGFDGFTLHQLMQRFRVPAISIAVIKDFEIHWAKTYGIADAETGQAADTGTVFQAASISKPVFAMSVVKLAQDGRLSLDADVNSYLKSWRVPPGELTREQPVTLRSLLSHTSGADDGFGFPGYEPSASRPTLVQILGGEQPSNVGPVRFARAPYAGMKYSGGGITLAQLAVMDVVGRSYAEIGRDLVLAPLGMSNSTFEQPMSEPFARRAARAHNGAGRRMGAPWHVYPEQAAAGLWTTPSDLARFAIEVQRAIRGPKGAVLTQASAREMLAPVGVGGFAVGLGIAQRGEGWYFSHGGSNWGFRCNLLAHVRKGYGVVIMTNGDAGGAVINEIEARVAAAYNWDSLDKPIPR